MLLTNEPVADTLPPVDQLDQNVQIGLQNKAGDSILSDVPPPSNHGAGRSVEPVVSEPPLEESAISITAEIMPEFPGGQAAFTRFLSKNLRVPENSMDPGQQIRIVVRFVVGKEGEISDFVFLQTNGEVFEEEVLRVMKKMPKWKPGSQNGKKVRVYFNLPVIFQAPEE